MNSTIRLTFSVSIESDNKKDLDEIESNLKAMCYDAIDKGVVTGLTESELKDYNVEVYQTHRSEA